MFFFLKLQILINYLYTLFFTTFNILILQLFPLSLFSILYSKSAQLPFSTRSWKDMPKNELSITLEKSLFLINDYHILFAHHFLISQIPCTTKIYGRDYMKTHANIIFLFYFNCLFLIIIYANICFYLIFTFLNPVNIGGSITSFSWTINR